ncbi:SRPBCC family protein [Ornithinibacter aureus]|uniref:SRPBCC family protein n=1 Tax=Ornithinibacter aureus TaxID=622664 RepID=A0ABP8K376_9MICO|nr:SRPBCC family protein [Ornithinibacter aureus]KAF0832486.1 polyketide cyclase/dehydrase/lipid transport protein [Ornithinibacter aureus]
MPTDTASATVVVDAPFETVLETIRDVAGIPDWVSDITEAEVLTTTADGMPLTARFAASTAVGTDRYTLAYEHSPDGLSWHLVEGRLQTAQDATYSLVAVDDEHTEVTFTLSIGHPLPLPGFIRNRTIKGLVANTTGGLKAHLAR